MTPGAVSGFPLQRMRPEGPVGHLQRHARTARQRRAGRRVRARPFRLSHRALCGLARRRARRPRRLRLHRRHRRDGRPRSARASPSGSAGSAPSSTRSQRERRAAASRVPAAARPLCRPDRRGTDDRPAHPRTISRPRRRMACVKRTGMTIPVAKAAPRRQEGPDRRHRQRPLDRLGLRPRLPRARRRARDHLSQRKGEALRRAAGPGGRGADLHAARRDGAGPDRGGVRPHRARNGASSISSSTPSPSRRRTRCRAASSTCRCDGFLPPWTSRAGRSCAWRISPSR